MIGAFVGIAHGISIHELSADLNLEPIMMNLAGQT